MRYAHPHPSRPDDSNVISLNRFRSGQSLSPLHQAESYWRTLHDAEPIPRRSQIDPRALENILPHVFILERIAPGIARVRIAGQALTVLTGMEVRGMPLSALFTAAARPRLGAALETVFDRPAAAELTLSNAASPKECRILLLPLRGETGQTDRALGVLVAENGHPETLRFDIEHLHLRSLDTAAPDTPQRPRPGTGPHLRLVETASLSD